MIRMIMRNPVTFEEAKRVCSRLYDSGLSIHGSEQAHSVSRFTDDYIVQFEMVNAAFRMFAGRNDGLFYNIEGHDYYAADIGADYYNWLCRRSEEEYIVSKEREERVLAYYSDRMDKRFGSEGEFLKLAKDFCELLGRGCKVIREAAATRNGVSDLLLCYKGRFVACELKAINGVPSPQQLKFIADIKDAGGSAGVCDCLSDIWKLMQRTAPGT